MLQDNRSLWRVRAFSDLQAIASADVALRDHTSRVNE